MDTRDQQASDSAENPPQSDTIPTQAAAHLRPSKTRLGLGAAALAALVAGLIVVAASTLRDSADPFSWIREGFGRGAQSHSVQVGLTPSFQLPDSSGKLRSSEEFAGSPVVLHFWASWCAPCIDEIPKILGAARALRDLSVRWVFVSLDHSWPDAEKILNSRRVVEELPKVVVLLDAQQKVSESFGSFQFPETYLFDAKGKRLSKWIGPQTWESSDLQQAFRVRFGVAPIPASSQSPRP